MNLWKTGFSIILLELNGDVDGDRDRESERDEMEWSITISGKEINFQNLTEN